MEKLKTTDLKTVSFFGSPHGTGYSSRLHDAFLLNFSRSNIMRVSAYKKNVKPCIACGFCKTEFKCAYDDMNDVMEGIISADVLSFSWPVYFSSTPSPMKALIDRFQPLWESSTAGVSTVNSKMIFYFITSGSEYQSVFDPSMTILKYVALTLKSRLMENNSVKLSGLDNYNGQKNFDSVLNKLKSESLML
ncbi:MAG: flavodoxin family protein [Spirochaetes bacterium]|nr:flavodoxin family protein [Spirochaetota bacterium]